MEPVVLLECARGTLIFLVVSPSLTAKARPPVPALTCFWPWSPVSGLVCSPAGVPEPGGPEGRPLTLWRDPSTLVGGSAAPSSVLLPPTQGPQRILQEHCLSSAVPAAGTFHLSQTPPCWLRENPRTIAETPFYISCYLYTCDSLNNDCEMEKCCLLIFKSQLSKATQEGSEVSYFVLGGEWAGRIQVWPHRRPGDLLPPCPCSPKPGEELAHVGGLLPGSWLSLLLDKAEGGAGGPLRPSGVSSLFRSPRASCLTRGYSRLREFALGQK